MKQNTSASLTGRIAKYCVDLKYEDLPPDVVAEAKKGILDTLGVTLIGSREEATRMMLAASGTAGAQGEATVIGTDVRAPAPVAALVNGYAAHAIDYDDTQHGAATHMSAPVISAMLVAGELARRPGKDLLAAYAAGFELGCKLGRTGDFGPHLHHRGVHPTSFLGHFGAAVAAGRLLGLDVVQMQRNFGIVGGQSAGLMCSFGTMSKPINSAYAAHDAIIASRLAALGFTGPEDIFETKDNIFSVAGGRTDPEALAGSLGQPYELMRNTFKVYACTGWRNPLVEAIILLAATHDLKPQEVTKIRVWASAEAIRLPDYPEPHSGLAGKFSVAHAAAAALIDRAGGVRQFTDERVRDPAVIALRQKVTLEADPKLVPFQLRVAVHTRDRRELTHFVPAQKGGPGNPLTWDEIAVKFEANASALLPKEPVAKLITMIGNLEAVEDAAELLRLCRTAA